MRITKARLDRYRRELDVLGDSAATYVLEYLSALDSAGVDLSVADIREETILAIEDSLNAFGDQASELACDLFEEVVVQGYGKRADVRLESVISNEMIDGKVRYLARNLVDGKRDEFRRDVADVTRYYVKRSAFENMERNCDRNDVRYARVPSGTETCAFCFMLSSRGFVYRSEETAGSTHSYHPHCNCIIVPGFKGLDNSTQIEGYDPDEMYDRWKACKETIGGDSALRDLWDGMTPKERSAYKGKSDSERYRRFVNAQTFKEVETRDFRWLNTGKTPQPQYESERAKYELNRFERMTRDVLKANGFFQYVRERSNEPGKKTSDIYLGENEVKADYKTPRGEGFNCIDQLMRDAGKKSDIAIIHLIKGESKMSMEDAVKFFRECGKRRGVTEAIFVDYDDSIKRIKI